MRKNKLVIALLLLVLLGCAGVAVWVISQPTGSGHNTVAAGNIDDSLDAASLDGGEPLTGREGNNEPSNNNSGKGNSNTGNTPTGNEPGNTGNTGNTGIDPNKVDSTLPKTEWVPQVIEATIKGRVTFKSDDRPTVGAAIAVEIADPNANNWGWRGPSVAAPQDDRPKAEVSGSTTTDGAGEFSVKVTMKRWQSKQEADAETEDMSGGPGPRVRRFGFEQVTVIATYPGYAPAKSQGIALSTDNEEIVNLKLAIPAALSGRVVDALTKEGIAGARGNLSDVDSFRDGGGSAPATFVTDEKGYFSLNALPASTYVLNVWADGYADYNGWQGQGRINLSGGGETDLGNIAMQKSTSVIGRVINAENGEPIASASVELQQRQQWGGIQSNGTSTDEDGRFSIDDVEPGSYSLRVRANDFAVLLLEAQTVEMGSVLDVGDLALGRGLAIRGVVTGADNEPLKDVVVKLLEPPTGGFNFGGNDRSIASTGSDAKGEFELKGATEGDWILLATLKGFAPYREPVKITGRGTTLKIRMTRGGTVVGRLLDVNGDPVPNATVGATSQDSGIYTMFKTRPTTMVGMLFQEAASMGQTGEDGRFTLSNIPAGKYVVFGAATNDQGVWKDDISVENEREVDVGDLRPPLPGTLQVTVTEDGVPVGEVEISLSSGMGFGGFGEVKGVTDSMGVALLKSVPEGTWYIRTSRDQSQFDTDLSARRVAVKAGQTTEFSIELRPKDGVYLHGRVTMNTKSTITDIILIGTGDRADVMKSINPVEGGYYEFVGLKTGTYWMHVREGDKQVTAKVKLDLTQEGDFPFSRDFKGYKVKGTVTTPEDSPAQRSSVSVSIAHLNPERPEFNAWLRGTTTCDADGAFEFTNVTPGDYQVTATLEGIGSAKAQVTITSGDSGALSFAISQNTGSIKVVVAKLNGTPVSSGGFALLTLLDAEGNTVDLGEGFQGFFMLSQGNSQVMPNVPPGKYTVLVRGSGYLKQEIKDVNVETGKSTPVDAELTAATELFMTVSNPEVTQAMLDAASVRYFDAQGTELPRDVNPFDSMMGETPPESPTLVAKYIGPSVTEVRIKLNGYAEIVLPVQYAQGKKIEQQETLVAE
ncbi:MAG: carboxypeptidase-like regulatory domain-containing protein [Planctomycetota bacterium]